MGYRQYLMRAVLGGVWLGILSGCATREDGAKSKAKTPVSQPSPITDQEAEASGQNASGEAQMQGPSGEEITDQTAALPSNTTGVFLVYDQQDHFLARIEDEHQELIPKDVDFFDGYDSERRQGRKVLSEIGVEIYFDQQQQGHHQGFGGGDPIRLAAVDAGYIFVTQDGRKILGSEVRQDGRFANQKSDATNSTSGDPAGSTPIRPNTRRKK